MTPEEQWSRPSASQDLLCSFLRSASLCPGLPQVRVAALAQTDALFELGDGMGAGSRYDTFCDMLIGLGLQVHLV
jgi:hypothetical protein